MYCVCEVDVWYVGVGVDVEEVVVVVCECVFEVWLV